MDEAGEHFFSGAALTLYQHGYVAAGNSLKSRLDALHLRSTAEDEFFGEFRISGTLPQKAEVRLCNSLTQAHECCSG